MIGTIEEIIDNTVFVKLSININNQPNLVSLHVVFEDGSERKVVGEITNTNQTRMTVTLVGEIKDNQFTAGASIKPSFKSNIRLIRKDELALLFGKQDLEQGYTNFGISNIYHNYKINIPVHSFFSGHFCIIGNSGSGKSCGVASILQNLYLSTPNPPVHSSFFFFDAYGEYSAAFSSLNEKNPQLSYKSYTTNIINPEAEILRIPIWLLDVDDLALLLDATDPAQLPIIEKTLKLVPILTGTGDLVIKRKNDIIARALQDILLSGNDSTKIRDQVIGVLTKFNTPTLKLDSPIVQPGYTRSLKQCLFVDKTGKMQEMELVVEFIRSFIIENEIEIPEEELNRFYSLSDLEMAMEFALVSEGILKSDKVYDTANIVSVRLHSLVTGDNRHYFDYPKYLTREQFIDTLLWDQEKNMFAQIVNFNINYIDDRMAKVIAKIISRMLFLQMSHSKKRANRAFHIVMEEAHRYVQHDHDVDLFGYNIFERITKEGRKYGVFLALITQRPSELSDTCVSQCSNFLIFRTIHPVDLKYIKEIVPNVSQEISLQLKNLKPGNCIAFGSAFRVPTVMYVPLPDPMPLSNDVDLDSVWYHGGEADDQGDVMNIMTNQASQQKFLDTIGTVAPVSPAAIQPVAPIGVQVVGNTNASAQPAGNTFFNYPTGS
ncbi:MAG: ATP-binding protein [Bacilli bacterium]|nr:ATP-binding protein [Bacilli bacterium]